MANATKWAAIGDEALLLSVRGASGYFAGWAGLTAASTPNTHSSLYKFAGVQALPLGLNEQVSKSINGDDGIVATFNFPSTDPVSATLEMGVEDLDVAAKVAGMTNYALGEWTMSALGGTITTKQAMIALNVRKAIALDSSNNGVQGYVNELWYNLTLDPLDDEGRSHQTEGKFRYAVVANPSTVLPWGVTNLVAHGATERYFSRFFTPNRFALEVHIGNNSNADIPLTYTPISTAKTKAFNGATGGALTVSSVSTGAKTATVSAAPASGAITVVVYETTDTY